VAAVANEELAKLRKDIETLQSDVGSLLEALKSRSVEEGRDAMERAKKAGQALKSEAADLKERAEGHASEHPITTLLTSFGLGFVIGTLFDRRR
jgi:ElaB/YqjD/DUF883 family membrane-anchored ribosome-binding protein